jgi:hypothetical protein
MKIFGKIFILLFIAFLLLLAFFYFKEKPKVCFLDNCFFVKIVDNAAERERGLMGVKKLEKNRGMFFIFDEQGIYPFWMKNTLIPLDIIWIDKDNKIVFIKEDAQPCEDNNCPFINTEIEAKYVLEINAGISKEIDLKVGDLTSFLWYNN